MRENFCLIFCCRHTLRINERLGSRGRHIHKAVGITVLENVETAGVSNGQAPTADGTDGAGATAMRTCPVSTCNLRIVDVAHALLKEVPNKRVELPAGVHLPVWKNGEEVK